MGINEWRGTARYRDVWRRFGMQDKAHPGLKRNRRRRTRSRRNKRRFLYVRREKIYLNSSCLFAFSLNVLCTGLLFHYKSKFVSRTDRFIVRKHHTRTDRTHLTARWMAQCPVWMCAKYIAHTDFHPLVLHLVSIC
jgi:hypothetical protein